MTELEKAEQKGLEFALSVALEAEATDCLASQAIAALLKKPEPTVDLEPSRRLRAQIAEHATPAQSARVPDVVTVNRADLEQVLGEVERVTQAATVSFEVAESERKELEAALSNARTEFYKLLEKVQTERRGQELANEEIRKGLELTREGILGLRESGNADTRAAAKEKLDRALKWIGKVVGAVLLAVLVSCGGMPVDELEVDAGEAPAVVAGGEVKPYLSVNGATSPRSGDGTWYPTGVAFDARADGWRLSCLNGRMPAIAVYGDGYLQLKCPDSVRQ